MAQDDEMPIDVTCRRCLRRFVLTVDVDAYDKWRRGGAAAQICFPDLTADERELLISSTCGRCYDAICKQFEEA